MSELSSVQPNPRVGALVVLSALAAICVLTLTPEPVSSHIQDSPWWCVRCGDFGGIDITANILLFVPLGLGFRLLNHSPLRAILLALVTTIGIETLQLKFVAGRDANIRDVLTNLLGAVIGFGIATRLQAIWRPSHRQASYIYAAVAAGWIASRILTGYLLAPSPPPGAWYGQIAPVDVYPANLEGVVHEPTINGRTIFVDRLELAEEFANQWEEGTLRVQGTIHLDRIPHRLASAISVLNGRRQEAFVLGVEGTDVVFRTRARAADFGFRSPAVRFASGIREGEDIGLMGRLHDRALVVAIEGRGRHATIVPLTSGLGWALMSPFDIRLDTESVWLSALWTGGILFAVAWFAARAVTTLAATFFSAGLLLIGLVLPPMITVAAPSGSVEWIGAMLGVFLGTMGSKRVLMRGIRCPLTALPDA